MNISERLQHFLHSCNISPAALSQKLQVQRSSISHLLSGRNKPSFDFIERLLNAYPDLNAEWIISGKEPMLKNESDIVHKNKDLFVENQKTNASEPNRSQPVISPQKQHRNITKIIVLYDDNSFEEFFSQNTPS